MLLAKRTFNFEIPEISQILNGATQGQRDIFSMIKSKFISDIIDLLLDEGTGQKLRSQVIFLTEKEYEYTQSGLFVKFSHDKGIEDYRATNDSLVLNGVTINSPEIELGAEAILHFTNGLADYLEIWAYNGQYPEKEIEKYTLAQAWAGSPGRKIVVG